MLAMLLMSPSAVEAQSPSSQGYVAFSLPSPVTLAGSPGYGSGPFMYWVSSSFYLPQTTVQVTVTECSECITILSYGRYTGQDAQDTILTIWNEQATTSTLTESVPVQTAGYYTIALINSSSVYATVSSLTVVSPIPVPEFQGSPILAIVVLFVTVILAKKRTG